ncbi:MAG: hypothetical protein ABSG48_02845 [Geobacteraceae bacterium]|jgi:hypothetical protein
MSKLTRHVLLGLLPLLLPALAAADAQTGNNSLPPETIQKIQTISQTVLTAKRNLPANPELDTLRQKIIALRKAILKLHGLALSTGKATTLSVANGQTLSPDAAPAQSGEQSRAQAGKNVQGALDQVRKQRALLQQKVASAATGEDHSLERNAAAKTQELEDELDKTLALPPEERATGLQALIDRLEVKHRFQLEENRDKTPTITTIVHHRQ